VISPASATAAALSINIPYLGSTTTTFTINSGVALASTTTYVWYYHVIG
jgi:hypothetical protein